MEWLSVDVFQFFEQWSIDTDSLIFHGFSMQNTTLTPAPGTQASLPRNECICPICKSTESVDVFEVRRLPVHVGIFGTTRDEARSLPTGDIILSYCPRCEFVHNRVFDSDSIAYRPGYEVALHHSPTFRNFMEGVAARLMDRFSLHDKRVLEIGCGCAYFLRMLADLGDNDCIGYDPTVATEGIEHVGHGTVELVRDYFGAHHEADADFICCLSVFEHIASPVEFLTTLRSQIGERAPGIYFEVFNAFQAISQQESWSIHYEQVNYFSQHSLAYAFEQSGFRILESNTCYEGEQYVFVDAVPALQTQASDHRDDRPEVQIPIEITAFADHHRRRMELWSNRFDEYRANGHRVVVWGSGGKGISFLNTLPSHDVIRYVVEINPDKHGKFIPGSAQEIVPPEFLAEYQPDVIIITNALYEPEMRQQARELGVECEFLIA